MKWMLCYQTPYNVVKYISDNLDTPAFLKYEKFMELVSTFMLQDKDQFRTDINKFRTLFIDIDKGAWHVYQAEKDNPTFDDLIDLNIKKEENKQIKTDIDIQKEAIKKFFEFHKRKSLYNSNYMGKNDTKNRHYR
jgi:uncharacterized protein YPO0396